ncbi:hypothetical protein ABGB17_37870 [Sphaerisporangium sp. B11E5]|uniref:hypothetical protein n=1 Tax=Sphaerisporangium sp. B11E5 TaxID=3153563 RepID=UPI00325F2035
MITRLAHPADVVTVAGPAGVVTVAGPAGVVTVAGPADVVTVVRPPGRSAAGPPAPQAGSPRMVRLLPGHHGHPAHAWPMRWR